MAFFNWFKKNRKKKGNYIDDEMRELSLDVRRKKSLLRQLEIDLEIEQAKQELNTIKSEEFQQNPEMMLFNLINTFMSRGQNNANGEIAHLKTPENSKNYNSNKERVVLSQQQIETFFNNLSIFEKTSLKMMSDDNLKQIIKNKIPSIDEESLNLCVTIARENR